MYLCIVISLVLAYITMSIVCSVRSGCTGSDLQLCDYLATWEKLLHVGAGHACARLGQAMVSKKMGTVHLTHFDKLKK